jgi:ribosome-binding protein aMBF1 (putative translation factor)
LGIAQRRISVKYEHKLRKSKLHKPLPLSIQTIGDWIQVKRLERNLSSFQLALKMGIATTLVRAWEHDTIQPTSQQLNILAGFLGALPDLRS